MRRWLVVKPNGVGRSFSSFSETLQALHADCYRCVQGFANPAGCISSYLLFNAPVYAKVTSGRDRVNKTTATITAIKDINGEPDLSRNTTALDRTDNQWEKTSETKLTASVLKQDQSTEKLLILIKRYKTCAHFYFIFYFIVKKKLF